jgi:hypothetical protein
VAVSRRYCRSWAGCRQWRRTKAKATTTEMAALQIKSWDVKEEGDRKSVWKGIESAPEYTCRAFLWRTTMSARPVDQDRFWMSVFPLSPSLCYGLGPLKKATILLFVCCSSPSLFVLGIGLKDHHLIQVLAWNTWHCSWCSQPSFTCQFRFLWNWT